MKHLIEKYISYLENIREYSQNTILGYQKDLFAYQMYLEKEKIEFARITKNEIWEYLKYLDFLKYSNASIARHITAIRSFYQYLKENDYITTNVFKTIRNPKIKKSLPNALNNEEIESLLTFEEPKNAWEKEEILIFEMLYATGLRVSELSNIKIKDIDQKEKSIRAMGKGKKERIVFYGEYAKKALDSYLESRQELLPHGDIEYLLVNTRGGKLSRNSIEGIVDRRVKKIALAHHISPHTLRHTFATHMLENGADIRTVQELLGHEKLGTTQIYTHLTSEFLRKEYLNKLPRK